MLARMEARARELGVSIELGSRVDRLPEPPVIVATSLDAARQLLRDDSLHWDSGRTLLLDLGLRRRRGDAFVISELDEAGWAEDYAVPDPTVAPPGLLSEVSFASSLQASHRAQHHAGRLTATPSPAGDQSGRRGALEAIGRPLLADPPHDRHLGSTVWRHAGDRRGPPWQS
jgi:hypothetical protein